MDLDEFEAPQSLEQVPPSPNYVHGPKYLKYVAPADDDIPEDAEEDLEEDPADGGDDDDEEESFEDDDDDEEEEEETSKEGKDEEKEHLAPTDSTALPAINHVVSAEETIPFETDESTATPPPPRSPQTGVFFS
uniref:Uncharacterized protein n=1 Tax=Tanacetum cinerariifolium TaxID=118510 RepID=A0A699TZ65_TANCI|nr:hypothetical protein [Tanacetum cinerariifolium]